MWQVTPKLSRFRQQTFMISVTLGQESGCGLGGSSVSRCLTGHSHLKVLMGRRYFKGDSPCWLLAGDSSSWPRGPRRGPAGIHQREQERTRNRKASVCLQLSLGSDITPFCHILFIRRMSPGLATLKEWGDPRRPSESLSEAYCGGRAGYWACYRNTFVFLVINFKR